jgi:hypothetical protein
MKRKYREAMRAAARERDAIEARDWHEETAQRRTLWPPMPVKPAGGEPWRPVMTEQQKAELEQRIKEFNLPF